MFTKHLDRPVTMLNDADAAGVAEVRFGAGTDRKGVVVMITLGTGIGSAVFTDGVARAQHRARSHRDRRQGRRALGLGLGARTTGSCAPRRTPSGSTATSMHLDALLWPDLIILGGGVSKQGEKYLPHLTVRCRGRPGAAAEQRGHRGRGAARLVTRHDVVVLGGGPAALAAASACAQVGLSSPGSIPAPGRAWPNTYGVWVDQLDGLDLEATLARRWDEVEVVAGRAHRLRPRVRRVRQRRADDHAGVAGGGRRGRRGSRRGRQPRPLRSPPPCCTTAASSTPPCWSTPPATGPSSSTGPSGRPWRRQLAYGVVARCSSRPFEPGSAC